MPDPKPKPKDLRVQSSIFNQEQLDFLMLRCEEIISEGYNRIVIEFKNGHPDILERRHREQIPYKVRTYQSE